MTDELKVSDAVRRLNPHLFRPYRSVQEAALAGAPKVACGVRPEVVSFHKNERELQAACERLLAERGYLRMTAANAERAFKLKVWPTVRWFGHMPKTIGNPFMPDLFMMGHCTRPLLVELKTRPSWRPGQLEMMWMGFWVQACNTDQFQSLLVEWERTP